MALTMKQKKFVEEYLQCWNGTEAARRAGYKNARQSATENLAKPYIAELIQKRLNKAAMKADEVLERLSDQARGIPPECIEWWGSDEDGYQAGVNLKKLIAMGLGHLIKGIRNTKDAQTVEFYDAQTALIHIGRHHKLFTDMHEVDLNLPPVKYIEPVPPPDTTEDDVPDDDDDT